MLLVNLLDIALKVFACFFGIVKSSYVVPSKDNTLAVIGYMLKDNTLMFEKVGIEIQKLGIANLCKKLYNVYRLAHISLFFCISDVEIQSRTTETLAEPTTEPEINPVFAFTVVRDDGAATTEFPFAQVITSTFSGTSQYAPFTCPLDGVYEFTLHVTAAGGQQARLNLATSLISSEIRVQDSAYQAAGSTSVIVPCSTGSVVGFFLFADSRFSETNLNTFSGELLFLDASNFTVFYFSFTYMYFQVSIFYQIYLHV